MENICRNRIDIFIKKIMAVWKKINKLSYIFYYLCPNGKVASKNIINSCKLTFFRFCHRNGSWSVP